MVRNITHFFLLGLSVGSVAAQDASQPGLVKPREVRKLVADGKHNAFTALAKFKDHYWLAFRSGKGHNSGDGVLVVLKSSDTKDWKEAFRLHVADDDRDPQFLVTDKRLFLYDPASKGAELTTYVTHTDDGDTWSKPRPIAYESKFLIWKPCVLDGKFYSGAHKIDNTNGGKNRAVHLVASDDGVTWQKISTIRAGAWESETTLHFTKDKRAVAFLRQKYGSPPCQILEAEPPYTDWKQRPPGVAHMSGHCVHTLGGVTYFVSRTMDYSSKKTGTMIYTFAEGKLAPYCELPSGGDCSYAEVVQVGREMMISYYSSHEGATNIYLAFVPLKK